ncbi:MAG: MFS transporter [Solirubrobacterales bacterium]|nr:MFS transporter [Solirubrobacterales bacterium]
MSNGRALAVLAGAQFLMVLDQSVMNVSISQLVADFDTSVTTIQTVITLYSLVMAALMITGGKLGDVMGRRRAFTIGLVVYGLGSALTAVSWSVGSLTLGWSILEGIGAALVLPALVALTASTFSGRERAGAYGVLGGVAGAGIAVGPILGGWLTTNLTWRLVFAGEVVIVILLLIFAGALTEKAREGEKPRVDWLSAALSALGLSIVVLGVLQSSKWGWLEPRNPPFEVLGFSPVPFLIAAGLVLIYAFVSRQRTLEERDAGPLVRLSMFRNPVLGSGLQMFCAQNLILLGIFFTIPLYLQVVQGFDAFETGLRMLPVSIAMLIAGAVGGRLSSRVAPRRIVRLGLVVTLLAVVMLLATIDPQIDDLAFAVAMSALGLGMGLVVSQLGNVVQSAVGESERSEAGGLQYTAQQFGAALGTALIGAVLISGLVSNFGEAVASNAAIGEDTKAEVGVRLEGDVSFVSAAQIRDVAEAEGLDETEVTEIVGDYEDSQLQALKTALLVAGLIVLGSLAGTRNLPRDPFTEDGAPAGAETTAAAPA